MDLKELKKNKKPLKRYLIVLCGDHKKAKDVFHDEIAEKFEIKKENVIKFDLDKIINENLGEEIQNTKTEYEYDEMRKKVLWQAFDNAESLIHESYHIMWPNDNHLATLKLMNCARQAYYIVVCLYPVLNSPKEENNNEVELSHSLISEYADISMGYYVSDDHVWKALWAYQKRFETHCEKHVDTEMQACDLPLLKKYSHKVGKKFGNDLIKMCERISLKPKQEEEIENNQQETSESESSENEEEINSTQTSNIKNEVEQATELQHEIENLTL